MTNSFFSFGEILWDCLPSGRHAGGAPFNVAAHLAHLGVGAALISAIGKDALGDEILEIAQEKGVDTRFIAPARNGLPTGTVLVTLDAQANATYEIVQPVAWDEIAVSAEALEAVGQSRALIFGSLAARSPYNRAQLEHLLPVQGPRKFFDVNLRPPFVDPALVIELAKRADVIKLNDDEAGRLASWVRTGEMTPNFPGTLAAVAEACAVLSEAMHASCICVTRAAQGAVLWENGRVISAPAPAVTVKDTVGAGDAFTAGLMVGLSRGMDAKTVLENACRLGAFVASHHGATPMLPRELVEAF